MVEIVEIKTGGGNCGRVKRGGGNRGRVKRGGGNCGGVKRGGGFIRLNEGIGGINDPKTTLSSARLTGGKSKKKSLRVKRRKRKTARKKK